MRRTAIEVDALPSQSVEGAVVRLGVDSPEAAAADVGQARAEAIAEQPEQAEHNVAIRAGVGHDPRGLQLGLLLQHNGQQHQAVAQRSAPVAWRSGS